MKDHSPLAGSFTAESPSAGARLRLMTKVQMIGWFIGAILLTLSIFAPPHTAGDTVLWGMVALAVAFGGVIRLAEPSWLLNRVSLYSGIVVISVIMALSEPPGMGRLLYLWPIMSAVQFLGRRDLLASMGLLGVTMIPALAIAGPSAPVLMYVLTMIAFGIVAGLQLAAVEQLQRTMRMLELVAITDSLTGLLDRRGFLAAIERDLDRARRSGQPVTLVQFDLDRFKEINDNFGHAVGDAVLSEFAAVLEAECRGTDVAARIGGEEFAVLLFDADEETGRRFAVRVAAGLGSFVTPGNVRLTVSAGVAAADRSASADQLLWAADEAVYKAKDLGRDQIVIATPAQHSLAAA